MMDYEARTYLSREQIRLIAFFFRKMFKVRTVRFPVLKILDKMEKKFSDNLYVFVDEDENFESTVMAALETEYDDEHYCIRIRESVYNKATEGERASIGFICHEMCHFFLILFFSI